MHWNGLGLTFLRHCRSMELMTCSNKTLQHEFPALYQRPALCTMVHKGDLCFWEVGVTPTLKFFHILVVHKTTLSTMIFHTIWKISGVTPTSQNIDLPCAQCRLVVHNAGWWYSWCGSANSDTQTGAILLPQPLLRERTTAPSHLPICWLHGSIFDDMTFCALSSVMPSGQYKYRTSPLFYF